MEVILAKLVSRWIPLQLMYQFYRITHDEKITTETDDNWQQMMNILHLSMSPQIVHAMQSHFQCHQQARNIDHTSMQKWMLTHDHLWQLIIMVGGWNQLVKNLEKHQNDDKVVRKVQRHRFVSYYRNWNYEPNNERYQSIMWKSVSWDVGDLQRALSNPWRANSTVWPMDLW